MYCENHCETEDEYIDTMSEQDILNQLWLESFGPGTGFDQDDRRELGGWLVEDSDGNLHFEPFPGNLDASICRIGNVPPPSTEVLVDPDDQGIITVKCI